MQCLSSPHPARDMVSNVADVLFWVRRHEGACESETCCDEPFQGSRDEIRKS